MYFLLSKILLFLILPVYWIIALVLIGIFIKNKRAKKGLFIAAGLVFYLFSIPVLLNLFEKVWDYEHSWDLRSASKGKKYSCVIVLGGFSGEGGDEGGHFTEASDRFIQSVKLYNKGQASHILITGGSGMLTPGGFREATYVKTQLKAFNVPDSAILIESNSKNTLENARFTKDILIKSHLQPPYLLVTSAFHMRRAIMIFRHAGLQVDPYSSDFMTSSTHLAIGEFLPEADVLRKWEFYIKEVIGYAVNYFK